MSNISVYNPPRESALKDLKRYIIKARGYSNSDVFNEDRDALCAVGCEYDLKNMGSHAMYWYKLAAAKNSAKAENNIGMLYNFAKGVQLDYSLAMGWYIKAARKYNQDAFANIAKLLEMGFGLSENKYMALEWYSKYHSASFHIRRLEDQGFYLAIKDKDKSNDDLIKELEEYIEYEKLRKMAEMRQPLPRTQSRLQELVNKIKPQQKDQTLKALYEKQLQANGEKINSLESSFQALQAMADSSQTKIASLKQTKQTLKNEKHDLENQIQQLLEREKTVEKTVEKRIKKRDDRIKSLRLDGQKQLAAFLKKTRDLESTLEINQTLEHEKKNLEYENEIQSQSIHALEQQLKTKRDELDLATLKGEIHGSDTAECINGMLKTFEHLLQSRTRENDLIKENMQLLLDEEKRKNKILEKQVKFMQQKMGKRRAQVNRYHYNFSSVKVDDAISDVNDNVEYDSDDNLNDINYDTPSEEGSC